MKNLRKLTAFVLIAMTVLSLAAPAFAANTATKAVTKEAVYFRQSAATDAARVAGCETIAEGVLVDVLAWGTSFTQIAYNGYTGYARTRDLVALDDSIVEGTTVTASGKTVGNVYFRAYPTKASSPRVAGCSKVAKGNDISIVGKTAGGLFYKIIYKGFAGYALVADISVGGQAPETTTPTTPTTPNTEPAVGTGVVNDAIILRKTASSSTSASNLVFGTTDKSNRIPVGATVDILGTEGVFYRIRYNGTVGYGRAKDINVQTSGGQTTDPTTPATPNTEPVLYTGTVNDAIILRKTANTSTSTSNLVFGTTDNSKRIPVGATVDILAVDGTFYRIRYNGSVGYARTKDITAASTSNPTNPTTPTTPTGDETVLFTGVVTDAIILRKTANSSTSKSNLVMGTTAASSRIPVGAEVSVLKDSGSFYYLKWNNYYGYARKSDLADKAGQTTNPNAPTIDGTTPSGSAVLTASQAEKWNSVAAQYNAWVKKNADTRGFIYVPGTSIYYPIMYSSSWYYNDYTPDRVKNSRGSIYMYMNSPSRVTAVTGHNMRGSAKKSSDASIWMFHELHHVREALMGRSTCSYCGRSISDLKAAKNTVFNITIPGSSYTSWQLFSCYEAKGYSDLQYNAMNSSIAGTDLTQWIQIQKTKSDINFGVTPDANDYFTVLVTCGRSTGDNYTRMYMFLYGVG